MAPQANGGGSVDTTGWSDWTSANAPLPNRDGAIRSWDTFRWYFNVIAASQHDNYQRVIDSAGALG